MTFELLDTLFLETGPTGQERAYKLNWRPGGRSCKTVNYQVKVVASSDLADLRVQVELWHGPDGSGGLLHSTPIAYVNPGTPVAYLNGNAGTDPIGEHLMVVVKIKDNAATTRMWARVEIYETRKPF